jgi:hypothetical protein
LDVCVGSAQQLLQSTYEIGNRGWNPVVDAGMVTGEDLERVVDPEAREFVGEGLGAEVILDSCAIGPPSFRYEVSG